MYYAENVGQVCNLRPIFNRHVGSQKLVPVISSLGFWLRLCCSVGQGGIQDGILRPIGNRPGRAYAISRSESALNAYPLLDLPILETSLTLNATEPRTSVSGSL